MSLLCNSRAEETYSMGCKENGIKTQREGLGDLKHWLRPLVLPPAETANDCKLSSDRCSVMAPVHVLLHKCVHHSPCCRQAYMDKPALAAGFFFFDKSIPDASLQGTEENHSFLLQAVRKAFHFPIFEL